MTESPPRYTDLDLLKQLTAQGLISAQAIAKVLGRFLEENPNFANNQDIQLAIRHADVITAQLLGANGERIAKSDDPDHFSDGRPVVGVIDAGGSEYKYVWFADPDHPYNHPAPDQPAVATVSNSTGRIFDTFVVAPHEVGAIELGDEEADRS
ncbi:hypothetical protein ACQ86B_17115 [Mycolicibacterium aichiense]|uniref:hypothetical protein n=1 Tax=Mycolicibacterium aichiense TaxID=1799 RepID=UPI003D67DABC